MKCSDNCVVVINGVSYRGLSDCRIPVGTIIERSGRKLIKVGSTNKFGWDFYKGEK